MYFYVVLYQTTSISGLKHMGHLKSNGISLIILIPIINSRSIYYLQIPLTYSRNEKSC